MAKPKQENQLDFGFSNPLLNVLSKYRQNLLLKFAYFETRKFVRSPFSWLAITSILALTTYQSYLLFHVIDQLPSQLPLFAHIIDLKRKLAPAEYIILLPALTLLQSVFSINISFRAFYKSKEFSYFVLFISVFAALLLTVAELRLIAGYYG